MTVLAPEPLLRELEALAIEVDALDAGDDLDVDTDARLYARRQRLLVELATAGVFERSSQTRTLLAGRGLAQLVEYHDAAVALHAYLVSVDRMATLGTPPPANALDSRVSLDWFRRPGADRGQPLSAHAFLASCERAMASVTDVRGVMFAKFSGALHALHYRREVVDRARLYRAGERGVPARPLTVSLQAFTMPGRIVVRAHDRPALTYVAYGVSERGIRKVAEQAIPEVEHAAWQDALVAAGMRVGGVVGTLVWAFGSDDYALWRAGVDAGQGTRTGMADVLGVIASPTGIRLRRRGAREDVLLALDDARACATCARELARWRGCAFVDET